MSSGSGISSSLILETLLVGNYGLRLVLELNVETTIGLQDKFRMLPMALSTSLSNVLQIDDMSGHTPIGPKGYGRLLFSQPEMPLRIDRVCMNRYVQPCR